MATLDETINAAMSSTDAGESVNSGDTAPQTESVETAPKSESRQRDESGKFTKPEKDTREAPAKAADAKEVSPDTKEAGASPTQSTAAPEAPAEYATGRLTKSEKAILEGLPGEAQQLVRQVLARQDASHTRRMQEVATSRKDFAAIDQELSPHRQRWQANGVSDAQAVRNMLMVDQALNKDPAATIQWLAQYAGVDLSKLGAAPENGNGAAPPQPAYSDSVMREIAAMKQQLAGFQQQTRSQQEASVIAEVQPVLDSHPQKDYLPLVEQQLPSFIAAVRSAEPHLSNREVVEQAIDNALYAHPQTRQLMLDAEHAKVREAALAKSNAARSKAVSVTGSAGPTTRNSGNLSSIIDEAMGRFM